MPKNISTKILFISVSILTILIAINYGCIYKRLLGITCPGCGLTRAYKSLIHGDIKQAFYYHPLFWTIPIIGYIGIFTPKNESKLLLFFIILFVIVYIIRILTNTLV